jgi:hypothetical protein
MLQVQAQANEVRTLNALASINVTLRSDVTSASASKRSLHFKCALSACNQKRQKEKMTSHEAISYGGGL